MHAKQEMLEAVKRPQVVVIVVIRCLSTLAVLGSILWMRRNPSATAPYVGLLCAMAVMIAAFVVKGGKSPAA
jgi:hypothetical protein